MAESLTSGAIKEICGANCSINLKPVLQVMDLKLMQSHQKASATNTDMYKLLLSDGSFYLSGIITMQRNELRFQKGSVIRLNQFISEDVENHKIIIVNDVDVVVEKCELIGEPVALPKDGSAESGTGQSLAYLKKIIFDLSQEIEKEVRTLKLYLTSSMNRKDSELKKLIEDLRKQNEVLADRNKVLADENQRLHEKFKDLESGKQI